MDTLKGVSRSFYLSLRLLPDGMREAAVLAYLLARASDTLADASCSSSADRLVALDDLASRIAGNPSHGRWPDGLIAGVPDPAERRLLTRLDELLEWLELMDAGEAALVKHVLGIIIGAQKLDIEHFAGGNSQQPVVLGDESVLDDYTWRVAGCVGEFWTRLGYHTLHDSFSEAPMEQMERMGVALGKGLQLVNILRDLPRDLADGRCYLPVEDPTDLEELMSVHQRYVARAYALVHEGYEYTRFLKSRRLKVATVLPAILADETLELMRDVSWERLAQRVKVGRGRVYASMLRALFH